MAASVVRKVAAIRLRGATFCLAPTTAALADGEHGIKDSAMIVRAAFEPDTSDPRFDDESAEHQAESVAGLHDVALVGRRYMSKMRCF